MSWLVDLYKTYEACVDNELVQKEHRIAPPFHVVQLAYIEVAIDGKGVFRRAEVIQPEYTVVPATEKSSTARTSGVVPHALCDHIKYCAGDYVAGGKENESKNRYFEAYICQLKDWCESDFSHPKVEAIYSYLNKKRLLKDLVKKKVVTHNNDGSLKRSLVEGETKTGLFKHLTATKGQYKIENALIRWRVESKGDPESEVWRDKTIQQSWLKFCESNVEGLKGWCHSTGKQTVLAAKHPGGVRGGKDKAKLISNKERGSSDFVYLGRFTTASQAAGVSRDVSFKAHSCLQWLIKRQGFNTGELSIVAWTICGTPVPDPAENTSHLFTNCNAPIVEPKAIVGDVGQTYSLALRAAVKSYKSNLKSKDEVILMGIDSASDGRAAITLYRKIKNSEFLDRISRWHEHSSWFLNISDPIKGSKSRLEFVGAPSLRDIAKAALGKTGSSKSGKKLIKNYVARLAPCVYEGTESNPIPFDIVNSVINHARNRVSFKRNLKSGDEHEWENCLGIACALFRGYSYSKNKDYSMTLERENCSRDYLYGRLLAVADNIEGYALKSKKVKRDTAAARYMNRFSDRPFSTWPVIYNCLAPYLSQLKNSSESKLQGFLVNRSKELDEIMDLFESDDFKSDKRLSGEFLLAFHCQRRELLRKGQPKDSDNTTNNQK